jgi:hypothetical protein
MAKVAKHPDVTLMFMGIVKWNTKYGYLAPFSQFSMCLKVVRWNANLFQKETHVESSNCDVLQQSSKLLNWKARWH